MVKTIFFDIGGVICEEFFRPAVNKYAEELNIPHEKLYEIVHDFDGWKNFSLGKITEAEYLSQCQKRAGMLPFSGEKYTQLINQLTIVNHEMIDLIKKLSTQYSIGIISNHPKEWFDRFIKNCGLENTITVTAISGEVHVRKPDKNIFQIALTKANALPEEAVYIDDREDMVNEARELGINIIVFDGDVKKLEKKISPL